MGRRPNYLYRAADLEATEPEIFWERPLHNSRDRIARYVEFIANRAGAIVRSNVIIRTGERKDRLIEAGTLIRRNSRVAFHKLGPEQGGVLLHLDTGAYHGVNEIGFLVWQILEEDRSFEDLLKLLRDLVQQPPATLSSEIAAFVRDLSVRDLLRLSAAA